ncbi:MAG: sortase [Caldilineaceae bacterium]
MGADLSRTLAGTAGDIPIVVKRAPSAPPVVAGQPTFLEIPAIELETVVEAMGWQRVEDASGAPMSQWLDVQNAAGWLQNSAVPGAHGNTVLSGHNNIKGAVFRDLWKLQNGDLIYLNADHERFSYVIEDVYILPEEHANAAQRAQSAAYIAPAGDERLTLVSCWPPTSNTHRVFVVAKPVTLEDLPIR